jgi:putative ABC transport system permease protein
MFMRRLRAWFSRLGAVFGRRRRDRELSAEMESHLQLHIEDNLRSGMTPQEARRQALLKLGGLEQTKENYRERRGLPLVEVFFQDLRFGARMLWKNPGFTATAVVTLALGIGVNTTIFSIAEAFLVHPLALPSLDRVVAVTNGQKRPVAPADYFDWKSQSHSFEHISAYRSGDMNLTGNGEPERVYGAAVSADFFATLSVEPSLGRAFSSGEDEGGRDQVVVLSHGLWQRHFGADAAVLGKSVSIDGRPLTVIGVMDKSVEFPVPTDLWIPLALTPKEKIDRAGTSLHVVAQLKPGANLSQAQAEMALLARHLSDAYPATNMDRQVQVMPLVEFVEGTITRAYTVMLLVIVGIVLLVACANVANLQFARATSRKSEIAVRTALGAGRSRIIRQLLTESVLLALLGGAASLLFAGSCLWLCVSGMPSYVMRLWAGFDKIRLDGWAFAFTFAAALGCGILAGILPALDTSKQGASDALRGGRGATAGRGVQRLRSIFVAAQVAVALVLVVAAALLIKGFREMTGSADAYAPERVLTLAVNLPASRYAQPADRLIFYRKALDGLSTLPGVQSVAAFGCYPLSNNGTSWTYFQVEGRVASDERHSPWADTQSITPAYPRLMQVRLEAGKAFTDDDRENTQPVVIVNQKLSSLYWPKESPLGKHIRVGAPKDSGPWLTVIGVAADVLYDWTTHVPAPTIYRPLTQAPQAASLIGLRTSSDPASLEAAARARIAGIDPDLPAFDVKPLDVAIHESTVGLGYTGAMMGILGFIALAVAVVGIYGVMAYSVGERTKEFGLRMALGARPRDILWLAGRKGLIVSAVAFAVGFPSSIVCARLLASLIFGTSPGDPFVFVCVPLALLLAVIFAGYIPARRATRVDPMVALRYE